VITYVRGYHADAVFECLWASRCEPGAAQAQREVPRLNFYVNLPKPNGRNSSYGIKYFRCEGFDYDVWQKNSGLNEAGLTFASTALGRPRSECMFLSGLYGPPDPPIGAGVRDVAPDETLLICYWAFDQLLPEFPPGPPGNRRPDAGDRRAVLSSPTPRARSRR